MNGYNSGSLVPDGATHLFFTELELLRRVASLVPPTQAERLF
ncbi:hypothetical protein POL68_35250 [Stigmatella sp. ncwal1]|uniref:Transposase n=1 Tax=Stigmatella ashevillensis TaxID=2995309 RepID=A0ABT5DN34_9BACT|nr:hypothetical protein [Stigmatella ashevillena]MDC0713777.1 hypothetical protein [Stigmatella ashevillena]